jgi:tRNA-specific 2-thiouridylase
VKFGALLERAREIGASHLATGHYARVGFDEECGRWVLGCAVDKAKDQSYSLYELRQEHLARAWFPLGGLKKSETRARAAKLGLSVANKPDSQEICFVSSGNYGDYLMRVRPETARPGPILDRQGRQLGRHRGIAFYTVGQRHGLRVAGKEALYVVGIDAEHDRLVVGGEEDLKSRELTMREVNYVSLDGLPTGGKKLRAKIRYGALPASCTAWAEEGGVRLRFARFQRAVAPGQAAVCYEGDKVALGGIIVTAW